MENNDQKLTVPPTEGGTNDQTNATLPDPSTGPPKKRSKLATKLFGDMVLTKKEKDWAMYDAGNSAIYMFLILIGVSIGDLAHNVPFFGDNPTTTMSIFNAVSGAIIAIMGPIMGAIADNKGRKKPLFRFFVYLGLFGCLFSVMANFASIGANDIAFFVVFAIGMMLILIGLGGSLMFYDSMLADVTTPQRGDMLSSRGYAYGYIGSLPPFLVCLLIYYFFMDPAYSTSQYGVSVDGGYALLRMCITVCLLISGVWWYIWTRPLLKSYEQIHGVDPVPNQVRDAFKKLGRTFKDLKKYKKAFIFMIAFFFYINGVNTIIALSATYATEVLEGTMFLGKVLETGTMNILLIVALIMTQVIAFVFSLLFGKLAERFGAKALIVISVIGYLLFVVYGVFMRNIIDFFVLAAGVGIFQGGIQALSRSYFSRLVPLEKMSEFFGLYDIFNKSSNFLGSAMYAAISSALIAGAFQGFKISEKLTLGVPQISVLCLSIFFVVGLILLMFVKTGKADRAEQEVLADDAGATAE